MNNIAYELQQVDGAYVNSLVDLVNACRAQNVDIDKVRFFQNGWHVTFKGYDHADAICHDGSYGSPCYMAGFAGHEHENDWSRSGEWETIGFPWDGDDVSVHSAEELAFYLKALNDHKLYPCLPMPWEEENEDC